MNLFAKKTIVVVLSAFALFAGCKKKPQRPDPNATVIGQQNGGGLGGGDVGSMGLTDGQNQLQQREGVIETEDKIIGLIDPVYFDFDKYGIKEGERAKIQAAKDHLDKNPQHRVLFEGHCDWRGTGEYNLALGDRRANAARQYLESLGVPANRIEVLSKGSIDAKEAGTDAEMAKDRKAEIVILKK